ncbi:hypothetical protein TNCV_3766081 [Trichonephila clavipes]|nr:hypothetical protein TNCV_3766081 [Trichonephila clavipes]
MNRRGKKFAYSYFFLLISRTYSNFPHFAVAMDDSVIAVQLHECFWRRGPRNFGQVTRTTPELPSPSPNYHTTPTGRRFSSRQI